jgi:hypothetical protein
MTKMLAGRELDDHPQLVLNGSNAFRASASVRQALLPME